MSRLMRTMHPTNGKVIWEPSQLSDDSRFINGVLAVGVTRAGRYEIRICRYPEDALKPISEVRARLKIGDIENTRPLSPETGSVIFEMDLKQAPSWCKHGCQMRPRGKRGESIS